MRNDAWERGEKKWCYKVSEMTTMLALRLEWGGERINMYINGIRKRKMVFGYRGE